MDNFDLRKYLAEGRLFENNNLDLLEDTSTPRGRVNNQNRNYSPNNTNRRSSEGRRNN
jgi:hypothetical protein